MTENEGMKREDGCHEMSAAERAEALKKGREERRVGMGEVVVFIVFALMVGVFGVVEDIAWLYIAGLVTAILLLVLLIIAWLLTRYDEE